MLGRPLFVVPWNITTFRAKGSNKLLEDGANILTNFKQILTFFNYSNHINSKHSQNMSDHKYKNKNVKIISNEFKDLYQYINKNQPVIIEKIYSKFLEESISTINSKLIVMELNNLILKCDEKYFTQK